MKFIFSLAVFLFGFTTIDAQKTFNVTGKIEDFHDKVPLPNAVITIGTYSEKSDSQGNFSFKALKKGTYTLTAIHSNCKPFSQEIAIERDSKLELYLEHHISDIENVTIHGAYKNKSTVLIKTLDQKELERNSTENLGNLLTSISGVGALKSGNSISKPIIHGLYGSRVSIINNGVKMAEQEWGVEHAPNIDANQFEH